jgi:hypothetical protein
MAAIGFAIRLLALLVMYLISNPKLMDLKSPEEAETLKMRRLDSPNETTKPALAGPPRVNGIENNGQKV